jgi:hypothetical protein
MFRPSFGIMAIFAVLLLCQCSDKATGPDQVRLGEAFTLTTGSTVEVQGKNISLTFQKVLDDSRCPANLECYWQGVAEIEVVLRSKGGDSAMVTLGVLGGTTDIVEQPFFVDTLGYRLSLLRLEPYPAQSLSSSTSDARLAQGQSRATLKLELVTGINHPIGSVEITDTPLDSILLDYFYIDSVAVEGDTLRITAHYSGCCKEHYFLLFMSPGSFLESNPVQADLCLRYYANHDTCECLGHRDLQFDLSPIADLCLQTYGAPKPIMLNISEFTNSVTDRSFSVEYVPAGAQRNRPPVLSSVGSQTVRERDTLQFTVSATDPDGTIPIMSTEGLPSNAIFVDNGTGIGTFLFLPDTSQAGDYQIAFAASDGMLADTETVAVHVEEYINHAPVMTEIGPQSVEIGDTLRFVVAATDPDGTIPVIMAENLPSNASLMTTDSNGSVFWFAPDTTQVGIHGVLFYATDGELADSEDVQITAEAEQPVNHAPIIVAIEPQFVIAGNTIEFIVTATDTDGTIPTIRVAGTTDHMGLQENGDGTAIFSLQSTESDTGVHALTFIASDGVLEDSTTTTITVLSLVGSAAGVIPMAAGNYWVYQAASGDKTTDSTSVIGSQISDGQLFWTMSDPELLGDHVRVTADSLFNEYGLQFAVSPDSPIRFAATGVRRCAPSPVKGDRVMVRVDTTVTVPAGTFSNCYKFVKQYGEMYDYGTYYFGWQYLEEYYIATGVGIVYVGCVYYTETLPHAPLYGVNPLVLVRYSVK